jgi:exosortase B
MFRGQNATPALNDDARLPWIIVLLGLAIMYLPSIIDLFQGPWSSDQNAHGPIVMALAFYFLYFRTRLLLKDGKLVPAPALRSGCAVLLVGLILYTLGRSQGVLMFEIGSLVVVLSGLVIAILGTRTWLQLWFAFFFMLFMIPLPGTIVDAITLPMKIAVSYAAEHVLFWLGYPVARSGVMLAIGQYQLLVANACSGLSSLLTLEALGLLYMNLVRHPSVRRNLALALLIVPISFTANTVRILCLALITYYYGDAASQGFLHGFSSALLFLCALLLVFACDSILGRLIKETPRTNTVAVAAKKTNQPALFDYLRKHAVLSLPLAALTITAMLLSSASAHLLLPTSATATTRVQLDNLVPKKFDDWTEIPSVLVQTSVTANGDGATDYDQPYDEIVMRTYANKNGDQVMLALAYAKEQRQDVKIHFPEACYRAAGFNVSGLIPIKLPINVAGTAEDKGTLIRGNQMLATQNDSAEAVTYWVRIGDDYASDGWQARVKIFRDGLMGKKLDGILVRASIQLDNKNNVEKSYALEQSFLRQLVHQIRPGQANVMLAAK